MMKTNGTNLLKKLLALSLAVAAAPLCATKGGKIPKLTFLASRFCATHKLTIDPAEAPVEVLAMIEAQRYLAQHQNVQRAFGYAVNEGNGLVMHGLIRMKVHDEDQRTLLYEAAMHGNENVVRELLAYGVDAGAIDKNQDTPLHVAAWRGHAKAVIVLLKHGADVNACNKGGDTALQLAAACGHTDVVQALLAHGADVTVCTATNETALDLALRLNKPEVVAILRAAGAPGDAAGAAAAGPANIAHF